MTSPIERPSSGREIPIGRQLAATFEAAIRDRHIPPGARLPATRDLARQLGLDRGTVGRAYARLRRRGCAVGAPGKRLRVRGAAPGERSAPGGDGTAPLCRDAEVRARDLARRAVAAVLAEGRESGISWHLLRECLVYQAASGPPGPGPRQRLTLYEPRPGLRRALAAELEARLGVPVQAPPPAEARAADGIVLHRSELRGPGSSGPEGAAEWVRFTLAGGTRERGIARAAAPFGLVVLLSVSRGVREFAAELAAREAERRMRFVALHPRAGGDVVRATAAARLVLYDRASAPWLPPTRARMEPIHLLPAYEVASLGGYLDLGRAASSPSPGGGGGTGRPVRRGS